MQLLSSLGTGTLIFGDSMRPCFCTHIPCSSSKPALDDTILLVCGGSSFPFCSNVHCWTKKCFRKPFQLCMWMQTAGKAGKGCASPPCVCPCARALGHRRRSYRARFISWSWEDWKTQHGDTGRPVGAALPEQTCFVLFFSPNDSKIKLEGSRTFSMEVESFNQLTRYRKDWIFWAFLQAISRSLLFFPVVL